MKHKLEFKSWMEANIFGFPDEDDRKALSSAEESDDTPPGPIAKFDWDFLNEQLVSRSIGELQGKSDFINEIHWGNQPGALQLEINTWYGAALNRLGTDLTGSNFWYTKRLFSINKQFFGNGRETEVVESLHREIVNLYEQPIDSPVKDYRDLRQLVIEMAEKVQRVCTPIFFVKKIHKINEDRYIIQLDAKGMGLEAPDHTRSEENLIDVSYDKIRGVIRVINADVESPVGGDHKWQIQPSDIDLYFMPTQSRPEIIEVIASQMHFY